MLGSSGGQDGGMAPAALPHRGSVQVTGLPSSVLLGSVASAYGTEEGQAFPPRQASHGARRLRAGPGVAVRLAGVRVCV